MTTFVRQLCNVDRYNLHLVICNSGAVVVRESFLEEVNVRGEFKSEADSLLERKSNSVFHRAQRKEEEYFCLGISRE